MLHRVRKYGATNRKTYYVHRFVWEFYNGVIPDGKVIDHINDDRVDNQLGNLQLMTQQENCKKSAKNRDYSLMANNFANRRSVKAINFSTKEETHYKSMSAAEKQLGIDAGTIRKVSERINYRKTGISKVDGQRYTFEYVLV